jgi:glutaredoxin
MFKKFLLIIFTLFLVFIQANTTFAQEKTVNITIFHSYSCPHCHEEIEFLKELNDHADFIKIYERELGDPKNIELFSKLAQKLDQKSNGVPFTLVGDKVFVGYQSPETTGKKIKNYAYSLKDKDYIDPLSDFPESYQIEALPKTCTDQTHDHSQTNEEITDTISVPILGKLDYKKLSLPFLTVVIAFLDGFNPCAMWVLVFLISLLLGMKDRKKMWILGSTFIITSGLIYFLFLTAWLNLFLFIGFINWVKIVIGIFAIAMGIYQLREYQNNKDGECKITNTEQKKQITDKLKSITSQQKFYLALGGIIVLAAAVNLIELVCSAGLPAIYTEVLALSQISSFTKYLYLILYILIFMLDDMVIFAIAMTTLKMSGIQAKYTRYSHLVGGIIILIIGILMILRPDLLLLG